jgi:DNA-binding response OmpR family regulator
MMEMPTKDSHKVLVIDDDQSVCRLIRSHLGANGYIVEVAQDGEAGLAKAIEFDPRLIILDLLLPGMDGFQVCRKIREDPALSSVKILMLTAIYLSEEDKLKGFRVGADEYIVKPDVILSKPIHLKDLKETVDAIVRDSTPEATTETSKDRVLVVDDDERNLRLMKMRLLSEGFEVEEVTTGGAALERMEPFQPHLLLLDINMPAMSGVDVLREVRQRGMDIPVVMMTAYGSEAIAVESFSLGADDYLIKPFDTATAARRLRQLIDGYRLKRSRDQLTERLKKISCDLVNRVNRLELQNQRLEEAYSMVRGLSEFNQRFIKSLSQELRAPLAMILSFSSLLKETPPDKRDPASEQECLTAIFRTAFRLEVNLSNLIYLSRLQAEALSVIPGTLSVEPLLEEVLALARRALLREDVHITWYPEREKHLVSGDPTLFKDILINLLDCSLQRMEGPGAITVELLKEAPLKGKASRTVSLRIRDDGTSFREEDLMRSNVVELSPESLRLGAEHVRLNLCRHLASLLGWTLELANRPTGGGEALLRMGG